MATKIFVDAGHGGPDPGAIANGVTEQAVNLNVANNLAALLRQGGYEVMQYRTTANENVLSNKAADLRNRANMANNWGADYFISIHSNSSLNPAANGFEAYVYRLNSRSAQLARSIVDAVVARLGSKDNGVRQANFAVLRLTDMPATLLELGYVSNPTEALNLNSPAWQREVAKAIYDGIYAFVKP
ncbi:MAG: N-acetylmuramoyl-L-alanine amidase [Clostridia bacterium]|nr:N-acetylmuramoyl-L-alanine amidase [Clostridia bacterium]